MKEILTAMAFNTRELLWKIEELKDKARKLESEVPPKADKQETGKRDQEASASNKVQETKEEIISKLKEGTSVLVIFSELVVEVEELIEKIKD